MADQMVQRAEKKTPGEGARPLYKVPDIIRLFGCARSTVYTIPGLADCRVPHAPGARFDPDMVDELLRAPRPRRRGRAAL